MTRAERAANVRKAAAEPVPATCGECGHQGGYIVPFGGPRGSTGSFWCPRRTFGDTTLDFVGMLRRAFTTPCIRNDSATGRYARAQEVVA